VLFNFTPLDLITYRTALALHFMDSVTGAAVADNLRLRAWAFDPTAPQAARRVDEAEKSQRSGIYGFRSLPGLEGYQIGDDLPADSLAFIVLVEDRLGRYLPQVRRYNLPLAQPAVQPIALFPAPDKATPTGYAAVRAQLLRTTAPAGGPPPEVTVVAPARWAQVVLTIPPSSPGDPPSTFTGQADSHGAVVIMPPWPLIADGVLLNEASWSISTTVRHQPPTQNADYALLRQILPDLLPRDRPHHYFPPILATLDGQQTATLFGAVSIVDPEAQIYQIVGPANQTELDFDLSFGRPLTLRTQVDGDPDHPLSELLIQSA
jgi:hypothetical protein